jgi:branched-chain amino acid transport system substrate-binding protein
MGRRRPLEREAEAETGRRNIMSGSIRTMAWALAAFVLGFVPAAFAQAPQTVKIGFASPLTGPQAPYGEDNKNGAQLAIEELNAQNLQIGGKPVKFELVVQDDQADPRTGTLVAQRLLDSTRG